MDQPSSSIRVVVEPEKSATHDVQLPSAELERLGKVNHHGPPPLNPEFTKDEIITRLLADNQLYIGKIKGYKTLGHLYQESKQECIRYKQRNEELANKLEQVMQRLSPESDNSTVVSSKSDDSNASGVFTSAPVDMYKTPEDNFEMLNAKSPSEQQKLSIPSRISESSEELCNKPSDLIGFVEANRNVEESTGKMDDAGNADLQDKSSAGSSASSPSFVCLGRSGLSSLDQTPSDSLPGETLMSTSSRPTFLDENLTDMKSLNDFLNDPNSSAELKALAADLLKIGGRAAKIEKQARVQQVLLSELQRDKQLLEEEVGTKKQELDDMKDKYLSIMEKLRQLEMERNPGMANAEGNASGSSFQSGEWVEVDKRMEGRESLMLKSDAVTSFSLKEMQMNNRIKELCLQISDLTLTNQTLTDGYEHSERSRQQLMDQIKDLEKQLQDQRRDDQRRMQDFDEVLLKSKKHRDELETEKEEATYQLLQERQRKALLQEKLTQLETKIYHLERTSHVEPAHLSSVSLSENRTLMTDVAILQQQVTIYKEDFDNERKDREFAQSQLDGVKLQLNEAKKDIELSKKQMFQWKAKHEEVQRENSVLKQKFSQALDELSHLKGQIRPTSPGTNLLHRYGPQPWMCGRCTYRNPGLRQSCEMCGFDGSGGRIPIMTESGMELTARGRTLESPTEEQRYPGSMEEDLLRRSSYRTIPKP